MSPRRRVALIVGAALIVAAVGLSLWRGNVGPLLILGAMGGALCKPP